MNEQDSREQSDPQRGPEDEREREISQIRESLRGLRFGSVTIVVQDGVIVQIDRTEKRRLRQSVSPQESGHSTR